ncbi:Wzz/FepE/Etk N-terminal domain-containing protein [Pseudorhodoferax sp. Leaf267]|uniref:Wzz/FepE/Etk N-terminal domain-containing protein n=1 Tax=Pseudorhodoferax sp. Leaf267 TaxID=1736316 RepID=UPI0006F2CA4E|nr:Wzz/FepE/Etk N-terminal domain-containing protein [Pseudorhodoferax sp. Leaf267]KQP17188.1 hypothetical protein ASF43_29440 [Pseudorhodoferax sp. Leaf267]
MNTPNAPTERRSTRAKPAIFPVSDLLGVHALWRTLWRHRVYAAVAFMTMLVASLAFFWLAATVWKADTLIQFEPQTRVPTLVGADANKADRPKEAPSLEGQMEVLRSRALLLPVIAEVGADVQLGAAKAWGFVPLGHRHGVVVERLELPAALRGRALNLEIADGRWRLTDPNDVLLIEGQVGAPVSTQLAGEPAIVHVATAGPLPMQLPLTGC